MTIVRAHFLIIDIFEKLSTEDYDYYIANLIESLDFLEYIYKLYFKK